MNVQEYVNKKKELHAILLSFLDDVNNDSNLFDNLMSFIHMQKYHENREELNHLLKMLLKISNNHHRDQYFIAKIEKILISLKKFINQNFTNFEIFDIFSSNKLILLFLIQNNIITIDENIIHLLMEKQNSNGIRYCHFFIPEIKSFINKNNITIDNKNFLDLDSYSDENYEEKRQRGENDSYICTLIRQDSVVEFISYVNRTNYPLNSQIEPSIFETNKFLLKSNPTLIEYAAFFGSIQIFQYLKFNNIEITASLLLYAIHSRNSELIQLIKENSSAFSDDLFNLSFGESIKCHHNDFAEYFENCYTNNDQEKMNELSVICCFRSYNYHYFPSDFNCNYIFYNLCRYNHTELVNLYIKEKENQFNEIFI